MQYKDYKPEQIAKKLKDVEEYEAKMGKDLRSKAWRKWCNSHEYRRREWLWRQNLAAANEELHKTIYHEERFI